MAHLGIQTSRGLDYFTQKNFNFFSSVYNHQTGKRYPLYSDFTFTKGQTVRKVIGVGLFQLPRPFPLQDINFCGIRSPPPFFFSWGEPGEAVELASATILILAHSTIWMPGKGPKTNIYYISNSGFAFFSKVYFKYRTHPSCKWFKYSQGEEIIKVREWIPHIGPLAKIIRLKLFLDVVPSSFADITRALRGCFRGGSVYISVRFVLMQSKASNSVKMSSLIFWLQAKELRLSVCCNTFRNFNRSLNKRRMYPAQTITIEWTAENCLDKW